jgi:hypothetical protein
MKCESIKAAAFLNARTAATTSTILWDVDHTAREEFLVDLEPAQFEERPAPVVVAELLVAFEKVQPVRVVGGLALFVQGYSVPRCRRLEQFGRTAIEFLSRHFRIK